MDSSSDEKREFKRIDGRSLVQFYGKDFTIYSNFSNIGEGGMFLKTYYMLDEGEEVGLNFDLPIVKKSINTKGKVVRFVVDDDKGNVAGLAIKFEDMEDEDRVAIKDFVCNLNAG